jgi:hypothetical protein
MDILWNLIEGFLPDFWPWIAGAVGAVFLFITGRSSSAAKVKRKQAEAGLKAATEGREAAREGKAEAAEALRKGKTPEEIVRGNDNAWR